SASLGRTAAWGAPGGVRPAAPQAPEEVDESASLGRTAAWGSSYGHRVATVAPAHPLQRTLDFEEDPPRISFPSTPPPGNSSIPPPLGFAAPEVSAWKGLTGWSGQYKAIENLETMEIPGSEEMDVETTFVSDPEDLPQPSPLAAPVETISLNSIPEAEESLPETNPDAAIEVKDAVSADAEADEANADASDGEFDDVPQRPTLMDFPPPPVVADVKPLIASMADLSNRDAIVELAFRCMSMFARRVALFSAKRNGFNGWLCNDAFGSPDELRKIVIPNDQPSVMATASTTGIYLGPIPKTAVHATLLEVMGQASGDVAVASVRVGGKVAAMLVCDELRDTLSGTRRLDELARAMGDALTRLVKTRA
ncbi:MAG TPA: hypothetical protein PK156_23980, partial [Polyangium sp.]|nr:hypothetical protein [Polyangium sp.]